VLKMDEYKINVLNSILENMKKDNFYLCRVKGDEENAINIDEKAIKLLIKYYSK
jgi:hypothetical protein